MSFRYYSSRSWLHADPEEVGDRGPPLGWLFVKISLSSELVQLYTKGQQVVSAQVSLFPLPPTSSLPVWRSHSASWEHTSGVQLRCCFICFWLVTPWVTLYVLIALCLIGPVWVRISLRNGTSYSQKYEIPFNQSLLTNVGFFLSIASPFSLVFFFLEKPLPPNNTHWKPKSFLWPPESDQLSHPVCRLSQAPLHRLRRGAETWSGAALLQGSSFGGLLLNYLKGQLSELQPWS